MRRFLLPLALLATPAFADQVIHIDGGVPDDEVRYFEVPFTVPAGIQEIEVHHDDLSSANILDWGLVDPNGFRGYGGGNEEPAIVGVQATSRSYLTGRILPGEWKVTVGKAKVVNWPASYQIDITLRTSPTLAPQPQRQPYTAARPLERTARWYAGDFHVHSKESGDAKAPMDDIANLARSRGLDFVVLTDHNTSSHYDFIVDAQSRHPDLLLMPGVEYTTYGGHANAIGATAYVDPRLGFNGNTVQAAVDAYHAQGALFSINHPLFDLPQQMCIGCAWTNAVPDGVDGVEIGNSGWSSIGVLFDEPAIAFWDVLSARGIHAKALGGSDDHRAGVDMTSTQSPIGDPTTMVFAQELSAAGILAGIREGRTVVKLQGPADPMIDFDAAGRTGDTVISSSAHLVAVVTGGVGYTFRFVRNGRPMEQVNIASDPFRAEVDAAPGGTADRWRAEVLLSGRPRTLTSNLWVEKAAGAAPSPDELRTGAPAASCSVAGASTALLALALVGLSGALRRRR